MGESLLELLQVTKNKQELEQIISCNLKTETFGLTLTKEEAKEIIKCRNDTLKKYERIELGGGMLEKLIFTFCDSQFINQEDYVETIIQLQDIFYLFKNECFELLTDEELLTFMKEQFEEICMGDIEYLESTCLERFAMAVRAGYDGYKGSGGHMEYEQFDEEQRWDKELYLEVLRELCWR